MRSGQLLGMAAPSGAISRLGSFCSGWKLEAQKSYLLRPNGSISAVILSNCIGTPRPRRAREAENASGIQLEVARLASSSLQDRGRPATAIPIPMPRIKVGSFIELAISFGGKSAGEAASGGSVCFTSTKRNSLDHDSRARASLCCATRHMYTTISHSF